MDVTKPSKFWEICKTVLQVAGLVVLVANLWLAAKLAPLASNDIVIIARVEALEKRSDGSDVLVGDVRVLQEQITDLRKDVAEIKEDVKSVFSVLTSTNR